MSALARRIAVAVLLFSVSSAALVSAQTPDARFTSAETLATMTLEHLLYELSHYDSWLAMAERDYAADPSSRWTRGFFDETQAVTDRLREAIRLKGSRPPGRVVRSGGGTTVRTARPAPNSSDSMVGPLVIFLTAADVARCGRENISPSDCATGFAMRSAGAMVIGRLILVVSPAGATAATLIGVASAAGEIYLTLDQAADNFNRGVQERANADRLTKPVMDGIVAAYAQRLADARGAVPEPTAVNEAVAALNRVVARAGEESLAFDGFNATTRLATARCADAARLPLASAARADVALGRMERQADAIVAGVADATRSIATCTAAQQAKAAYESAAQELRTLGRLGNETRADVQHASDFFSAVAAAKVSMPEAARRIAALRAAIDDVRAAQLTLSNRSADYNRELDDHVSAVGSVLVSINNLRGSLPADLPPHIADGFKQIDDAYTRATSEVLVGTRMNAIERTAADRVSDVEGIHRLATERFDDMSACGTVTGEMPEALRRDLARIDAAVIAAYRRAEQAVNDGKDLPGQADACARTTTVLPPSVTRTVDGRMAGECTGTIRAVPERATVGSQLMIQVAIAPPADSVITRVATDNPACRDNPACDTERASQGLFRAVLRFQAPAGAAESGGELGRFRVRFIAYDKDNRIRCTGQTPELTVLAPPSRR